VALVVLLWVGGMTGGNSGKGGKEREKQLQMEPRDLLALGMFRQLQFNYKSFSNSVRNSCRQQVHQNGEMAQCTGIICTVHNVIFRQSNLVGCYDLPM